MSGARYWLHVDGSVFGPFAPSDLARQPGFSTESLVCAEGGDAWSRAADTSDLASFLGSRPAPPPPLVSPSPSSPASNSSASATAAPETCECPYCAEVIKSKAIKCRYCGSNLKETSSDAYVQQFEEKKGEGQEFAPGEKSASAVAAAITSHISSSDSETQAVRRLATVVFADMTGFTALSNTLDDEDVHELMNAIFGDLSGSIERYGGVVDKYIGDCVMAVWGVTESREDDAVRATAAVLSMIERVRSRTNRLGVPLSLHAGINTGEVVLGRLGKGRSSSETVYGDAVNLASRLCDAAPTGDVYVGPETWNRLQERFEGAEVPLELKGVGAITAHGITAQRRGGLRHVSRVVRRKFLLREREVKEISAVVDALCGGGDRPAGMLIAGAGGTGKSRLCAHVLSRAVKQRSDIRVLFSQGIPADPPPFGSVVIGWLQDLVGGAEEDAISRFLAENPDLERWRETVRMMLTGSETGESLTEIGDDTRRFENDFTDLFIAVSETTPLILSTADIQWADGFSLDVMRAMAGKIAQQKAPILMLSDGRPSANVEQMRTVSAFQTLDIGPISQEEVRLFVESVIEGDLDEQWLRILRARTGGVILHLVQVLDGLAADGAIEPIDEDQWRMTRPLSDIPIPESLADLLWRKIERLGSSERELLLTASVCGMRFPSGLLAAALDRPFGEYREALELLQNEGFLLVSGSEIAFEHGSVREASRRMLLKAEKKSLAERILDRAPSGGLEGSGRKLSIELHREAGRTSAIAHHLVTESNRLITVERYKEAEELLGSINPDDFGATPEGLMTQSRYLGNLGRLSEAAGRAEEAMEYYTRALEIADANNDQTAQRYLHGFMGRQADAAGDTATALEHYAIALEHAIRTGDQYSQCFLLRFMAIAFEKIEEFEKARENYEKALDVALQCGNKRGLSYILANLARLLDNTNQLNAAQERYQQLADVSIEEGNFKGCAIALSGASKILEKLGRFEEAWAGHEQALEMDRRAGNVKGQGLSLSRLAHVAEKLARWEDAKRFANEALLISQSENDVVGLNIQYALLARVALAEKSPEEAMKYSSESLRISMEVKDQWGVTAALKCLKKIGAFAGWEMPVRQLLEQYGISEEEFSSLTQGRAEETAKVETELFSISFVIGKWGPQALVTGNLDMEAFKARAEAAGYKCSRPFKPKHGNYSEGIFVQKINEEERDNIMRILQETVSGVDSVPAGIAPIYPENSESSGPLSNSPASFVTDGADELAENHDDQPAVAPVSPETPAGPETRECPFCAEDVRLDETICPYCASIIEADGPIVRRDVRVMKDRFVTVQDAAISSIDNHDLPSDLPDVSSAVVWAVDLSNGLAGIGGEYAEVADEISDAFFTDLCSAARRFKGELSYWSGGRGIVVWEEVSQKSCLSAVLAATGFISTCRARCDRLGIAPNFNAGVDAAGGDGPAGKPVQTALTVCIAAESMTLHVTEYVWNELGRRFQGEAGDLYLPGMGLARLTKIDMTDQTDMTNDSRVVSRFIGREPEKERLSAVLAGFAESKDSRPAGVIVTGAGGTGKSRLLSATLAEFNQTAPAAFKTLFTQAVPSSTPSFGNIVSGWLQAIPVGIEPEELESFFSGHPDLSRFRSAVAAALSLDDPETRDDSSKSKLEDEITEFFAALSGKLPLILAASDLQWADDFSIDVIRSICRKLARRPAAGILLYLDARPSRRTQSLTASPGLESISLGALSIEETEAFLNAALTTSVEREWAQKIHERSGGVVLNLCQVLDTLADEGMLEKAPGLDSWRVTVASDELPVPESLADLLSHRIDRLPAAARQVLLAAAVCGVRFPRELLDCALEMPVNDIAARLQELSHAGFLLADEREIGFEHGSLRETARRMLLSIERRRIAERIIQKLGKRLYRRTYVQVLPDILQEAGNEDLLWGVRAREAMQHLSAWKIDAAAELLETFPAEMDSANPDTAIAVRRARGRLLEVKRDFEGSKRELEAALEISRQAENKYGEASVLSALARLKEKTNDPKGSYECNQQSLEIFRSLGRSMQIAIQLNALARTAGQLGETEKAIDYVRESIELSRQSGNSRNETFSLSLLGRLVEQTGNLDEGIRYMTQAQEIAERNRDERGMAVILGTLGRFYEKAQEYEKAYSYIQRAIDIEEKLGNEIGRAIVLCTAGYFEKGRGENKKSLSSFLKALEINRREKNTRGIGIALRGIGDLCKDPAFGPEAQAAVAAAGITPEELERAGAGASKSAKSGFTPRGSSSTNPRSASSGTAKSSSTTALKYLDGLGFKLALKSNDRGAVSVLLLVNRDEAWLLSFAQELETSGRKCSKVFASFDANYKYGCYIRPGDEALLDWLHQSLPARLQQG